MSVPQLVDTPDWWIERAAIAIEAENEVRAEQARQAQARQER